MSLAKLFAEALQPDGSLAFDVPGHWLQGRTAYGGLSSAAALAAAQHVEDGLPPLRSAQIAFVGPLAGRISATATLERRGRSSAFVRAQVETEDGVGLIATFLFMAERDSAVRIDAAPPPPVLARDAGPRGLPGDAPAFTANFDYAAGMDAWGASDLRWHVRLRDRDGLDPAIELLAVADALPPAALPLMRERAPISSATWMINFLSPPETAPDGWWLLRSVGQHAAKGFSSQEMAIWDGQGRPIATGMQSVALFG